MNRASCILFWFCLTLAVSLGLYRTSYRVDSLSHNLRSLNAQIEAEQRNIHVLKAEWVFLANPSRIEGAARKHLDLEPTKTAQIASLRKLSSLLPTRRETIAVAAAKPHPAASTPKVAAEEQGRVNTRLVFRKTVAQRKPQNVTYRFAGDDTYGIGSAGGAP